MIRIDREKVGSTILANSYYEVLTTTELTTEKIDGETVVTDPDDVFLVRIATVTIDELRALVDAKLVNASDAAARLCALSLALKPDVTDREIYTALVTHDFRPALVSAMTAMGKTVVIETIAVLRTCRNLDSALADLSSVFNIAAMKLLKTWGAKDYNRALAAAAGTCQLDAMILLKTWGATNYNRALDAAAANGHAEAMNLLKTWGASNYDRALSKAALKGRLEAMTLSKTWGATDYDWALAEAASEGQLEAMNLLKTWGATDYSRALANAASHGRIEAMELLKDWGALNYDWALANAALRGEIAAMKLLKYWGATNYTRALEESSGNVEAINLLMSWIHHR